MAKEENVTFNLYYQELLRRRFGEYEHSIYISRYAKEFRELSVQVYIKDRSEILHVRTPALRKDIIKNSVDEGRQLPLVLIMKISFATCH